MSEEKPEDTFRPESPTSPEAPVSKPKPAIIPPTEDELKVTLNAFVVTAMNFPDKPQVSLMMAARLRPELIIETVKFGLPMPWRHAVDLLFDKLPDDEKRLVACLFAVAFVQGAGMRQIQNGSNNGQ